jgi:hypothetical protein
MAINKFVSLDVPLMDLCFDTGIEHDRYRPIMLRWAKKCYSEFGPIAAAVGKFKSVRTCDGDSIALPEHATAVQIISFGDAGCECDVMSEQILETSQGMLPQQMFGGTSEDGVVCNSWTDQFRVENNSIVFDHCRYDGLPFTIRYFGYKNDCEGKLMVNELAVDAITAYIEVKLSRQSRWKNKEFRLSQYDIREIQMKYNHAFRKAKGELIQLNHHETRQLAEIVNQAPQMRYALDIGNAISLIY